MIFPLRLSALSAPPRFSGLKRIPAGAKDFALTVVFLYEERKFNHQP
jgi:hypothetical protein